MITYKVFEEAIEMITEETSLVGLCNAPTELERFIYILLCPIRLIIALIIDILFLWFEIPYGLFLKARGVKVFLKW